jgi:hypothetical protein
MKAAGILFSVALGILGAAHFAFAQTWTQTSAPSNNWVSVAMSADGRRLAAVANYTGGTAGGGIFISTNSGATWVATSAPRAHLRIVLKVGVF